MRRFEPARRIAPPADRSARDNSPDPAIAAGGCLVSSGGARRTGRVRMVIAQDERPAAPRRTVRGNQGCRIEFEMAVRLGMNVANRLDRLDQPRPLPQQQTTGLCRISLCRFCQECGFRATCHRRFHRHLL